MTPETATTVRDLSPQDVVDRVRRRELRVVDVVKGILARIEVFGSELNCFITVLADSALARARKADEQLASGGSVPPLMGLVAAVKDNFATAGVRTTAGSAVLADWIPSYTATAVTKLDAAGAIVIGKTNLFEFAAGGVSPVFGDVQNPWDPACAAGASSSGSAAAVAARLAHTGLGTDTGGSIRIPAAACGVVGLKPTFGRISRFGVIPGSYNLDHVGIIAPDVTTCAAVLDAVAGHDLRDPTTLKEGGHACADQIDDGTDRVRVGIPASLEAESLEPELLAALEGLLSSLRAEGAQMKAVELPSLEQARTAMLVIHAVECSEYHYETFKTRRTELSPGVQTLLKLGALTSGPEYVRSQRVRQRLCETMLELHRDVDILVLPTLPIAAWPRAATTVEIAGVEEDLLTAITRFTPLFNLTGQPAVSVPCGFDSKGRPYGVQLVGRAVEDDLVLRVARAYERAIGGFELPPLTRTAQQTKPKEEDSGRSGPS